MASHTVDGGIPAVRIGRLSLHWGQLVTTGLLALVFGLPHVDRPGQALFVATMAAVVCAIVMAFGSRPAAANGPLSVVLLPAILFVLLVVAIFALPLLNYWGVKSIESSALFDPSNFKVEVVKLLGLGCVFLIGWRLVGSEGDLKRTIDAVLFAGGAWALVAIIAFLTSKFGPPLFALDQGGRLTAGFNSPNSAATLFGSLSLLTAARLQKRVRLSIHRNFVERIDLRFALSLLVNLVALSLTVSRMGIATTVLALLILFLFGLKSPKAWLWGIAALVCLSGVAIAIFSQQINILLARFDLTHSDGVTRQTIFTSHLAAMHGRGLFGYGLGAFVAVNSSIMTSSNFSALWPIQAMHNVYLQWYEETGLLGLGLLVLLNLSILMPIFRLLQNANLQDRALGALLAYFVFLVHGLTDFAFQEYALAIYITFVLGAVLGGVGLIMTEKPTRQR